MLFYCQWRIEVFFVENFIFAKILIVFMCDKSAPFLFLYLVY